MPRLPFKWHSGVVPLLVPADTIRPHPRNPNNGDVDVVRESVLRNGVYRPIFVNKRSKLIVGGHTQYHVEVELQLEAGIDEPVVPVLWIDGGPQDVLRILAVDNASARKAEIDDGLLLDLLDELDSLIGSGYDEDDRAKLRADLDALDASTGDTEQLSESDPHARFSVDEIVEQAFAHYRETGFPYRALPVHEQMLQLNRLAHAETDTLLNSDLAYHVADSYHPHRFAVEIEGKRTPLKTFESDKYLRLSLRMCVEDAGRISDNALLSMLGMVRGAQAAANFRPAFALLMYRRFAEEGATVLDTSTGFGGRLVGFAASRCGRYIGIDPNVPTHEANMRMAKTLGIDERVELINLPAEDVDARPLRNSCDFAFTSPPYFSKEHYSDDETQSWQRYSTGNAWREGFLRKMLKLQHTALRRGAFSAVNIADVTIANERYPLVEWTQEEARAVGFDVERVERFPLSRVPGQGEKSLRFEPVIILRKP